MNKNKISLLIATTLAVPLSLASQAAVLSVETINRTMKEDRIKSSPISKLDYLPYLQIGGTRFFNVDIAKWATGLDIFIPVWQMSPTHLVFSQIRLYDRSEKPFEGNLHFGYRYLSEDNNRLHGIYGSFDRKRTAYDNYFNQLTFGVENWFNSFFIGANYYQPIGGRTKTTNIIENPNFKKELTNNTYAVLTTADRRGEVAACGGDIEIGYEFTKEIIGYAGGYYFKVKELDAIYGPRARVTYDYSLDNGKRILKILDKIGLEAGIQHDKVRGTIGYLSANFRVGLLPHKSMNLQGVARHMVDLVRRDVDIVTEEGIVDKGAPTTVKDKEGKELRIIEVDADTNPDDLRNVGTTDTRNIVVVKGKIIENSPMYNWIKTNAHHICDDNLDISRGKLDKIISVPKSTRDTIESDMKKSKYFERVDKKEEKAEGTGATTPGTPPHPLGVRTSTSPTPSGNSIGSTPSKPDTAGQSTSTSPQPPEQQQQSHDQATPPIGDAINDGQSSPPSSSPSSSSSSSSNGSTSKADKKENTNQPNEEEKRLIDRFSSMKLDEFAKEFKKLSKKEMYMLEDAALLPAGPEDSPNKKAQKQKLEKLYMAYNGILAREIKPPKEFQKSR